MNNALSLTFSFVHACLYGLVISPERSSRLNVKNDRDTGLKKNDQKRRIKERLLVLVRFKVVLVARFNYAVMSFSASFHSVFNLPLQCKRLEQELLHTRELSQANTRHLNMANNQERVRKVKTVMMPSAL